MAVFVSRHQLPFASAEAEAVGYGGGVQLSRMTGISPNTIAVGKRKLRLTHAALWNSSSALAVPAKSEPGAGNAAPERFSAASGIGGCVDTMECRSASG
jgi:hypothetical protein